METTFFRRNRSALIVSLLIILTGMAFTVYAVFSIVSSQRFIASMPTTEAEVINVSRTRVSGRYKTRCYVSFSIDGEEYAYIYAANAPSSVQRGDIITIHYDPQNPRSIAVAEQSYIYRIIEAAVGLLAAALGIKKLSKAKKLDKKIVRLRAFGTRIAAAITELKDTPKKSYYIMTCEYDDPFQMKKSTFISEPFICKDTKGIVGKRVFVLVDANCEGEYYVETDTVFQQ